MLCNTVQKMYSCNQIEPKALFMMKTQKTSFLLLGIVLLVFAFVAAPSEALSAEVTLSWAPPNDDRVTGYCIYYWKEGSSLRSGGMQQEVYSAQQTQCNISGLKEGVTYNFAATSCDAYGNESPLSQILSYRIPRADEKSRVPIAVITNLLLSD